MAAGPIESMVSKLLPIITSAFEKSIDSAYQDLVGVVVPVEEDLGKQAVAAFYGAYHPVLYDRSGSLEGQFTIKVSGYVIEFEPFNSYVSKLTLEGGYHGGEGYASGTGNQVWWNFPGVHKPAFQSTPPKDIVTQLENEHMPEWEAYLVERFRYHMGVNLHG